MIHLSGRTSSADRRIDHANQAIQHTLREIQETDKWVEEVEANSAQQQAQIDESLEQLKIHANRLMNISDRTHNLHETCDKLSAEIDKIKKIPAPLIPDLGPVRAEIRLIRAIIDQMSLSYNDEMSYLWKEFRNEAIKVHELERDIRNIKIPDLRPVYWCIGGLTVGILCLTISTFL